MMLEYRTLIAMLKKTVGFMRNKELKMGWNKWREVYAEKFDKIGLIIYIYYMYNIIVPLKGVTICILAFSHIVIQAMYSHVG